MSFRSVYAVCDAWHAARWPAGLEWRLLMLLARQTDDKSLTVIRSGALLGSELGVSDRHVRTHLKYWRSRGVLHTVEHGGGTDRKPAKYRLDLDALRVVAIREADRVTAERKEFRRSAAESPCGSPCSSAVSTTTSEVHAVPQLQMAAPGSGVEHQLRKEGDATPEVSSTHCGSPAVPSLQRFRESENQTKVGASKFDDESAAPSLAMAKGALARAQTLGTKRLPGRATKTPEQLRQAAQRLRDEVDPAMGLDQLAELSGSTVDEMRAALEARPAARGSDYPEAGALRAASS